MRIKRRYLYYKGHGFWPNLTSPTRFSEKINWRILNDRRPLLAPTCDKLRNRAFARDRTGIRLSELYWVGHDVAELATVALPERWVLKPNHSSGKIYIGSGTPDIADIRLCTKGWEENTYARDWGEWAYSQADKALLVEGWLGDSDDPPLDYRFYVFDGHCHLVGVDHIDASNHLARRRRFYRPDWTPLEATNQWPLDEIRPPPLRLAEMLAVAETLAEGFDMLRVDLYEVEGEIYFGELTTYPSGGLKSFDPGELDRELGAAWRLPDLVS